MRKHRITDGDAAQLARGVAPEAHPELDALAHAIGQFRAAALTNPPRPSAALMAQLELDPASHTPSITSVAPTVEMHEIASAGPKLKRKSRRAVLAWFAGLGAVAKVALGSTVALAAVTAVVTGAGVARVLPGGSQLVFDHVVSSVTNHTYAPLPLPSETPPLHASNDPSTTGSTSDPGTVGGQVSQDTNDPNTAESELGSLESHEPHDTGSRSEGLSGDNSEPSNSDAASGDAGATDGGATPTPTTTDGGSKAGSKDNSKGGSDGNSNGNSSGNSHEGSHGK